jgi:hypothetical protein
LRLKAVNTSRGYSETIAFIGLIGLIAVTLLMIGDVFLRWLFLAPIDGRHAALLCQPVLYDTAM